MQLGTKSVKTIGFITALALCAGTYFIGIAPILKSDQANKEEIQTNQSIIEAQTEKLRKFQSGEGNLDVNQALDNVENFANLIPSELNIESSSRAVAEALVPGVELTGFTFNPPQSVAPLTSLDQQLAGFNPLSEFSGKEETPAESEEAQAIDEIGGEKVNLAENTEAGAPEGTDAPVSAGFKRVPFIIDVTAHDYNTLSRYLENLSNQPRLMNVVSVDMIGTTSITATIYAFAFVDS